MSLFQKMMISGVAMLLAWPMGMMSAPGYEIRCTLHPVANRQVVFGHYFGSDKRLAVDDTLQTDRQGVFTIQGDGALPQGMYFLYIPNRIKIDFLIGEDQHFQLITDTLDVTGKTRFSGSAENDLFYEYNRYNQAKYTEYRDLSVALAKADAARKPAIRESMQRLAADKNSYIEQLKKKTPNTLLYKILSAITEPEIPEAPKDASGRVTDEQFQAKWFKAHFFDHFDLSDSSLLRTPFYENQLLSYFSQCVSSHPDSINKEVDLILNKVKPYPEVFRYNLITLWNHFVNSNLMGMDGVWVHMAETWYLPYGTWLTEKDRKSIGEEVEKKKYSLIGQTAPPMEMLMVLPADHFKLARVDSLARKDLHAGTMMEDFRKQISSPFTVILFWDVTCSHCQEVILKLHDAYPRLKAMGASVLTVQVLISESGKTRWADYVNEHALYEWTNAWSPYSADYGKFYDTTLVPIIYVLDKNKKIIGKQLQPEQLEDFLKFQLRQNP